LADEAESERWHDVMTAEFTRVKRAVRKGHDSFLGEQASRDEAEFFAVTSERFFTRPNDLRRFHPALYDMLSTFYQLRPIDWFHGIDGTT